MREHTPHPHVTHAREFLPRAGNLIGRGNDWLASHLAVAFGLVWTVWVFMAVPLLALLLPKAWQDRVFFLSSGWVQLWALPLFVFVGNKLQRTSEAQSEAQYQALTHIAQMEDRLKELIEANTDLTTQVHELVTEWESTGN